MSKFLLSLLPFSPFTYAKPMSPAIILTLPTELILEIGEMLDIMSLISLAKAHPLFTVVLDDNTTSLISTKSQRFLKYHPISPTAIPSAETEAYRAHYVIPTRFDHMDSILAPRELCAHEINLLNYLVAAGVARSFRDAVYRFSSAIKCLTRYSSVCQRYKVEPWFVSVFVGRPTPTRVFEKVELWLHRKHTERAVNGIAAIYSQVAEIVKMVDYVGKKSQPDTGVGKAARLPRFQQSCCEGVRTWDQLMRVVKSDPNYKEPVIQTEP